MIDHRHGWNVSFKPVIIGFLFSLLWIGLAYWMYIEEANEGWWLSLLFVSVAIAYGLSHLIFYLHLGLEDKPRWNLLSMFFLVLVIAIIIAGSNWIMINLDYNVMLE